MSDEHCVFAGGLRNGQIARLAVAKFGRRNFHETQALILNAAHNSTVPSLEPESMTRTSKLKPVSCESTAGRTRRKISPDSWWV